MPRKTCLPSIRSKTFTWKGISETWPYLIMNLTFPCLGVVRNYTKPNEFEFCFHLSENQVCLIPWDLRLAQWWARFLRESFCQHRVHRAVFTSSLNALSCRAPEPCRYLNACSSCAQTDESQSLEKSPDIFLAEQLPNWLLGMLKFEDHWLLGRGFQDRLQSG